MVPLLLLLLSILLRLQPAEPQQRRPPGDPAGCAAELVAMAPCLPFVSAPPGVFADAPSGPCCSSVSLYAYAGGGGVCLCHLVRDPFLLGFPLNASRVALLLGACGPDFATGSMTVAFARLCQETGVVPPILDEIPPALAAGDQVNSATVNLPAGAPVLPTLTGDNETNKTHFVDRSSSILQPPCMLRNSTLVVVIVLFLLLVWL